MSKGYNKNRRNSRNKRFSKGKGPTEQRNMREDRQQDDYTDAKNDISWYSKYPNLLLAAGSFPYPYRPGMNLDLGSFTASNTEWERQYRIPGVMSLEWIPSIGVSNSATDPASVLAKEFYAKVRARYSGSLSADAPDFAIYLLAMDSIFTYIAWLKRVYRVLSAWSPDNHVLPERLLQAMGLSPTAIESLRTNKTQFWQLINELVLQSRKFHVPAVMDIFNRHYWMSDNVYTDAASINSQFYIFNLKGVYKYVLNETTQVGELQLRRLPWVNESSSEVVPPITPTVLYTFGSDLINALVSWDDAYDISGYLMRAFEGTPVFQVDEIPADQTFNPVFEPEVLQQIENSRSVPMGQYALIAAVQNFTISQNPATNAIISNPSFSFFYGNNGGGTISDAYGQTAGVVNPTISVRSDSPTVADSVIASRLQASVTITSTKVPKPGDPSTTFDGKQIDIHCGTEIPLTWKVFDGAMVWEDTGTPTITPFGSYVLMQVIDRIDGVTAAVGLQLIRSLLIEAFDWHPFAFWTINSGGAGETTIVGDTHNVTSISVSDLDNLHKVCIYSELNAFSII